jgi:hypothetical protein
MRFEEYKFLLMSPLPLIDVGIQMIMPSLANLFGTSALLMIGNPFHLLGDGCPLFGSVLLNELFDDLILLVSPEPSLSHFST